MMPPLSIVTTLYRSAPHLEEFYRRITDVASRVSPDYELILVDDGSPDDSLSVALALCARDPRVSVVELSRNFGHHRAMMTGLARARGDLVFLVDCDLEEQPEWLEPFAERLRASNADVVYGVQVTRRGSWFERVSGEAFYRLFNMLSDVRLPRNVSTARLMRRRYVRSLVATVTGQSSWPSLGDHGLSPDPGDGNEDERQSHDLYHQAARVGAPRRRYVLQPQAPRARLLLGCGIVLASIGWRCILGVRATGVRLSSGWTSLIVSVWMLGGPRCSASAWSDYICHASSWRPSGAPTPSSARSTGRRRARGAMDRLLEPIARYYAGKLRLHGATALGVDWNSSESQERRFTELLRLCRGERDAAVNDYGCGYGALAARLRRDGYTGAYTGYDVSPEMTAAAAVAHASSTTAASRAISLISAWPTTPWRAESSTCVSTRRSTRGTFTCETRSIGCARAVPAGLPSTC